jgi:hypothetical protein
MVRGAIQSLNTLGIDGCRVVIAVVEEVLTMESLEVLPSSPMMVEEFVSMYATGFVETPRTAATGYEVAVFDSVVNWLITAAVGLAAWHLRLSMKF